MPDPKLPRGTDLLMKQSQETTSDRAKRINSLHTHVDKVITARNRENLQLSKETDSLGHQREILRRELNYARSDISNELSKDYNKVVKSLGSTIQQMSIGMKNISISTARATTNAISQYGKAIGQDININKTNTVVMALAQATPLFGYFAAKFMETDVFQNAAKRIKDKIGGAMVAGMAMAGRKISGMFGRDTPHEKMAKREREIGAISSEISSLKKEIQGSVPKMAAGGYVKKGGVVQVHAGEVVAPIGSIVKEIMSNMTDSKQRAWQDQMLKALTDLKLVQIGTSSRLRLGLQRTIMENPAMRGMLMFAEGFKTVLGAPIKWLFGARGGYLSDVKRATSTSNVFLKVANLLGVLYTTAMPKLDAIAKYTRVSATVAAGYEPSPPMMDKYTMFQKVKGILKGKGKGKGLKGKGMDTILRMVGVSDDEITEFRKEGGLKGMFGLAKQGAEAAKPSLEKGVGVGKGMAGDAAETTSSYFKQMTEYLKDLTKMKGDQEEREKPHSPSWVEYIGQTFHTTKERVKQGVIQLGLAETAKKHVDSATKYAKKHYERAKNRGEKQFEEIKKNRKANEQQTSFLGRMAKRAKGMKDWIWKIAMFAFTMFQNAISMGVRMLGWLLAPILTQLGIRGLFQKGGPGFISHAGKGVKALGGKAKQAGKFAGKTGRVARMAGPKAAGKFAAKGVGRAAKSGGKFVGKLGLNAAKVGGKAVIGLGAAISVGEMGWDAYSVMRDPQGFAGDTITRGFSAFIGGRDSGASGALSGAMKGGSIGAIAGSFIPIPIVGSMIGGAIGALAGGILGFIGGKRISKALDFVVAPIKKLGKAIWRIVTFPFKMIGEVVKFFKRFVTETETGKKIWKKVKFWAPKVMLPPLMMIWALKKAVGLIKTGTSKIWDKIKDTFVGKALTAIWDVVSWPTRKLIKLAGWIGGKFAEVWDTLKAGFMKLVGMFQAIPQALKDFNDWIYKKILGIPFIGKFLKGMKAFVKNVEEGTLADKAIEGVKKGEKKKTLDEYNKKAREGEAGSSSDRYRTVNRLAMEPEAEYRKRKKIGMNIALGTLGASAGTWNNGVLTRARIDDVWYEVFLDSQGGLKDLLLSSDQTGTKLGQKLADEEKSKRQAAAAGLENQTSALKDKMGEATAASVNATNVSSKNITSNTNNISSSQGGGRDAGSRGFGSGYGYASDVERCNIS